MTGLITSVVHQLRSGDVVLAVALALGCGWLCCMLLWGLAPSGRGWLARCARFCWQFGALLGLEQGYELVRGRMVVPDNSNVALLHAYRLLDFEWRHGFFVEQRIERFFLQFHIVMNLVDGFYVVSHLGVTVGVLVWIYTRRRQQYPFIRSMFIVTTAIALISFYVYPTAPPRMLSNYGLVDPAQLHNLVEAGGAQPDSYTYNPYAAFPSIHVAYALIVGWSVFHAVRHPVLRVAAVLYPVAMAAVVVISGNHWVLDVAGAVVTVLLARLIVVLLSRATSLVHQGLVKISELAHYAPASITK